MAQIRQYMISLSLKPIKASSDFILNYLKKRNIKNKHKHKNNHIFTMDTPLEMRGVSKKQEGAKDQ